MSNFKQGDKVFHIQHGWGVISELSIDGILVDFQNKISAWVSSDDNILSFTEYTLQGFTQERPVVLPEVGEICLVRDKDNHSWTAKEFVGYIPNAEFPYITEYEVPYAQMKRIKILD